MDSKLWYSRWKKIGFFLLVLLFFFLCSFSACLVHMPSQKFPLHLLSILVLPFSLSFYYRYVLKNHGRAITMPPLVWLATGQKERQNRLEKPGRSDQVTEVHGMTCSLALYQIHFTASSLSRCPVPTPGSRHRRDRCLTFAGEALRCIALFIFQVILCKWRTLNKPFLPSQAVLTLPLSVRSSLLWKVNLV